MKHDGMLSERQVANFEAGYGPWMRCTRSEATHLINPPSRLLVRRKDIVMNEPYGQGSGMDQDFVDRGHPGWVRVRRRRS